MFGCKHPADRLIVEKEATEESIGDDHVRVIYHLHCRKCGKPVKVTHAKRRLCNGHHT